MYFLHTNATVVHFNATDSFKMTSRLRYSRLRRKFQRRRGTSVPCFLLFPPFFSPPTGWNVNRGRDILQRGHGVRAWNQFKSCFPETRSKSERAGIVSKFNLHAPLARKTYSSLRSPTIFISDVVIKIHIAIRTCIIERFNTNLF